MRKVKSKRTAQFPTKIQIVEQHLVTIQRYRCILCNMDISTRSAIDRIREKVSESAETCFCSDFLFSLIDQNLEISKFSVSVV